MDKMTANDYRERGDKSFEKERESFDRCDTDGFVSQWCHNLSGQQDHLQAKILENGGKSTFPGLFHRGSGVRVKAKLVSVYNRFSYSHEPKWMVLDSNDKAVLWLPALKTRQKLSKLYKLGFMERDERAPAKAKIAGHGTGFSGLVTCHVITARTDGGYPDHAVPYDEI